MAPLLPIVTAVALAGTRLRGAPPAPRVAKTLEQKIDCGWVNLNAAVPEKEGKCQSHPDCHWYRGHCGGPRNAVRASLRSDFGTFAERHQKIAECLTRACKDGADVQNPVEHPHMPGMLKGGNCPGSELVRVLDSKRTQYQCSVGQYACSSNTNVHAWFNEPAAKKCPDGASSCDDSVKESPYGDIERRKSNGQPLQTMHFCRYDCAEHLKHYWGPSAAEVTAGCNDAAAGKDMGAVCQNWCWQYTKERSDRGNLANKAIDGGAIRPGSCHGLKDFMNTLWPTCADMIAVKTGDNDNGGQDANGMQTPAPAAQ